MNKIKTYICTNDYFSVTVYHGNQMQTGTIKKGDIIRVVDASPMMYILENGSIIYDTYNFKEYNIPESKKPVEQKIVKEQKVIKEQEQEKIKKKPKKTIPKKVRNDVWNLYIGKKIAISECFVCKNEISQQDFECGHIISDKNGGSVSIANLRPICNKCNKSMGSQHMFEYIKKHGYDKKFTEEEKNERLVKLITSFL